MKDLDVRDATFTTPDLTTFTRLDELGPVAVGSDSTRIGRCCCAKSLNQTSLISGADDVVARDSPYQPRRTLHTGVDFRTDKQAARPRKLFANDDHVAVELTWEIYQHMVEAYRHPDPATGRDLMTRLIDSVSTGVPDGLEELQRLGRTLKRRAADVLAYFGRPGPSNGPTEAING